MADETVMAGARISRALWVDFTTAAKKSGKTVAEALEQAIKKSIPSGKTK